MHNLACVYESQQRCNLSVKWFTLALEIRPNDPKMRDSIYGIALSQFKLGCPEKAIGPLNKAIEQLARMNSLNASEEKAKAEKEHEDKLEAGEESEYVKNMRKNFDKYHYFWYLRALCYRMLGNFEDAKRDYRNIMSAFQNQEGRRIASRIIAMIIMPLELNRKKVLRLVEQFHGIIDKYEIDRDRKLLPKYDAALKDKQRDKQKLAELLQTLSFFKRFSMQRIREMADEMTQKVVEKDRPLFFKPHEVYIIVSGSILMQNHRQQSDLPLTYAKFTNGAIMNFLQEKSPIFYSIETWFLAQVETEVVVFDKAYFQKIWDQDIMTEEVKLKSSLARCYRVFEKMSELAVIALVSEFVQTRTFKKGELIVPQSKYAPTCPAHQRFMQTHERIFTEKNREAAKKGKECKKAAH